MMTRSTPASRVEALEAVQRRRAGDAGHDAIAALEYTTAASLGIVMRLCHLLVITLLEGALLDPHASPVLACPECCRPCWRCWERG